MAPTIEPSINDDEKPAIVCVFCASSPGTNPIHLASARRLARCLHEANISLVYGGGTMGIMGELARTMVELYDGDGARSGRKGDFSSVSRVHGVIPRALVKVEPGIVGDGEGRNGTGEGGSGDQLPKDSNGSTPAAGKEPERDLPAQQPNGTTSNTDDLTATTTTNAVAENTQSSTPYGTLSIVPDMHTRKREMARRVTAGSSRKGSGFVALAGGYGTVEEVMEMVTWNQLGIHHMPIVLVNVDGYWDGLLSWVARAVEEGFVNRTNAGILVEVKDVEDVVAALREYRVAEGRWQLDWSRA